jgi:pimeloyl-ACP methyl ester carboxylesterase
VRYPGDRFLDPRELADVVQSRIAEDGKTLLVAESFSGPVALEVAARHPGGLIGVVLIASFVGSPLPPALRLCVRLFADAAARIPIPRRLLARYFTGGDLELAAEVEHALRHVDPSVIAARLRLLGRVNAREALLASRPLPILLLVATRDHLVPRSATDRITSLHLGVRTVSVPAPHLLLQSQPDLALTAISEFHREVVG